MVSYLFICERAHFSEFRDIIFYPKLKSISPPNQANTKNPGTSNTLKRILCTENWLPGRILATENWLPERYCALKTGFPEQNLVSVDFFSGQLVFSAQYLSCCHFSVQIFFRVAIFSVHCQYQDFQFLLDLEGKNAKDLDENIVSELRKMSSFTNEKLVDYDRIPLGQFYDRNIQYNNKH